MSLMPTRPTRRMPSIEQIIKHWSAYRDAHGTLPFADPAWEWDPDNYCWACGWDRGTTDRAHIVPRQPTLDGAPAGLDGPQNLVLLCKACHKVQPQTHDPGTTFGWMKTRPKGLAGLVEGSGLLRSIVSSWQHGSVPYGCFCSHITDEIRAISPVELVCPVHDCEGTIDDAGLRALWPKGPA